MLIFIPNDYNWKLDLSFLNVTFNDTNSMFTKENVSEYSYPFSLSIEKWVKLTNLHYNAADRITQFIGKLNMDGTIVNSTLKINTKKGNFIDFVVFSTDENFPSFSKKLNQLNLLNFAVPDIKATAEAAIILDYPDTDYNFPMVHTDKYDAASEEFNGFEQILNKYVGGAFVENVLELDSNIDLVKNILQPFPYLMYVLKKGFAEDGMILQGDVLNDIDLNRALICTDKNYYNATSNEKIPIHVPVEDWNSIEYIKSNQEHVKFLKEQVIVSKGDYILFGDVNCVVLQNRLIFLTVQLNDISLKIYKVIGGVSTEIYSYVSTGTDANISPDFGTISTFNRHVDINLSLDPGDIIRIVKIEPRRDQTISITPEYPDAIYLDLIPIRYRNPDGSPILQLLWLNKIDLNIVVPDMTFGQLVEEICKWKNLRLVPGTNTVRMDYINLDDRSTAVDLTDTEIEEPLETYHDERSYELLFNDGKSNEKYPYDSIFVDSSGVKTTIYKTNKNTTQIPIDALPYPVIDRNGIKTAYNFDDENSKLRLIFFKAFAPNEPNVCYDNLNMLLPAIYPVNYKNWLDFLLTSVQRDWEFIIAVEKWNNLSIRSLIYAYANFHLFSEIERERIVIASNHYWKISAKSETLF
jgi:hypothetical protein